MPFAHPEIIVTNRMRTFVFMIGSGLIHVRALFLLLIISCLAGHAGAQTTYNSPDPLRFRLINRNNGLSSNTVHAMMQDHRGIFWLGTMNGLNRYDGLEFKQYRNIPGDPASVPGNSVRSITQDPWGKIWITTGEGHLSYTDERANTFKTFHFKRNTKHVFPHGYVKRTWFSRDSSMFLAYYKEGFAWYDKKVKKFVHVHLSEIDTGYTPEEQQIYNSVYDFYEDPGGLIWIAAHNGMYTYHRERRQLSYIRKENPVPSEIRGDLFVEIHPDGDSLLWLASWSGGIVKLNLAQRQFTNYYFPGSEKKSGTTNIVEHLVRRDADSFWFTSLDKGFGYFNVRTGTWHLYDAGQASDYEQKAATPEMPVNMIMRDRNRNIWIAHSRGISIFNTGDVVFRFNPVHVSRSSNNNIYYITEMLEIPGTGELLAGTAYADGLHVLDLDGNTTDIIPFFKHPGEPDHYMVNDLFRDSGGRIWVITRDRIYIYKPGDKRLHQAVEINNTFSPGRSPDFTGIRQNKDGSFWITTGRMGPIHYDAATGHITLFTHLIGKPGSLLTSYITEAEEDNHGYVWFVCNFTHLARFNTKDSTYDYFLGSDSAHNGLPAGIIYDIASDPSGKLWLGTSKGPVQIISGQSGHPEFRLISFYGKSQSTEALNILFTPAGDMWYTTRTNLCYMEGAGKKVLALNMNNGLKDDFPNYTLSAARNGKSLVGTSGGYYVIDLSQLGQFTPTLPDAGITSFKVMGTERNFDRMNDTVLFVELNHNQRFFSFDFTDFSLLNPNQVRFEYFLQGLEHDWVDAGMRRFAGYSNLGPGTYRFHLRARGEGNQWVIHPPVTVKINPAFWTTWWFYLLSSLAFTAIIFSGYAYRIRMVRREESIKARFRKKLSEMEMTALRAQMNPHFIFNCLNSINRYIVKSDQDTASLYLTKFSKLIRLILDNSKSKYVPLDKELHAIKLYIEMEALRFDNKFVYEIRVDPEINQSSVEIPPMLLQPYVENAIWHGLLHKESEGRILIDIRQKGNFLICDIEDDGVGRQKAMEFKSKSATKDKSLGMKITSDRLAILNSENFENSSVTIHDLVDHEGQPCGTRVELSIRIHHNSNSF
jgi:ligand-binding sensor domain-containing protein